MAVIEVAGLTKTFRVPEKEPGLRGSIKALFWFWRDALSRYTSVSS